LSGALLGYFDLNVIFLIEFVTFLVAVAATGSTVIPRPPKVQEEKGSMRKEVMTALGYIWERKGLAVLMAFSTLGKFQLDNQLEKNLRNFSSNKFTFIFLPTLEIFFLPPQKFSTNKFTSNFSPTRKYFFST
jgi:hypothetical protein